MHAMLSEYWPHLTIAISVIDIILILVCVPWILLSKKESTSTVAWCLLVLFLPLAGALFFWIFGYNFLLNRVRHQRGERGGRHKQHPHPDERLHGDEDGNEHHLGELAERVKAYPVRHGNALTVYHETERAF